MKEIIEAFCQGCGTKEVGIATNGSLTEVTLKTIYSVLDAGCLSSLSVQVSLDGLEGTHDAIRGVKRGCDHQRSDRASDQEKNLQHRRRITREYFLRQIAALKRKIGRFERKYGMRFQQFSDYLHERSVLLEKGELSAEQRQTIMQEEDKWLEREETKETEVEKQLTQRAAFITLV